MTERERFDRALHRLPITGHVPTFELVFFLTMEAFGKVHPAHRNFAQWNQMSAAEKKAQIDDQATVYVETARRYHHSAILVHPNLGDYENTVRLLDAIREKSGNEEYYVLLPGDPTFYMPDGDSMMEFSRQMFEEEEMLLETAKQRTESFAQMAKLYRDRSVPLDGFALCSDYCFNVNPFFSPALFEQFIAPFLKQILDVYRELGFGSIKHTDGNIMPILDQMVDCGPDALHSIDPQGGVSLAEVKRLVGDRVALCGNVNCGLLQTGTDEECITDIRRSLREGMEGGTGYVFCTSNCAYTGMPLERYELMNRIWWEEGIYPEKQV